jgi:hypothetical protein
MTRPKGLLEEPLDLGTDGPSSSSTPSHRADPPVRPDGTCARCGKPRHVNAQVRKYAGHQIDTDPFCSTACCRAHHGTTLDARSIWEKDHGA